MIRRKAAAHLILSAGSVWRIKLPVVKDGSGL